MPSVKWRQFCLGLNVLIAAMLRDKQEITVGPVLIDSFGFCLDYYTNVSGWRIIASDARLASVIVEIATEFGKK